MLGERRLHLERGDVLAGAADDVLQAVYEMQLPVGTAAHGVAGVEPAPAPRVLGRLRVLAVAGEESAPGVRSGLSHQQFGIVGNPELEIFLRLSDAARADVARLAARGDHRAAAGLGHGPGLDEREAETRLESGVVPRVGVGAEAEAHAMRALVRAFRKPEQDRRHDAEIVHDRRARLGDLAPPAPGVEALELDDAPGGEDHRHRRGCERVHVEQRQRRDQPLLAFAHRAQAAFVEVAPAHVEEIEVAEQATLRLPGRAGRIEQGAFVRRAGALAGHLQRKVGRHHEAGLAVLQDVVALRGPKLRIHRHDARAEGVQREEMEEKIRPAGEQEGDPVAAPVSLVRVAGGDLLDARQAVAVGEVGQKRFRAMALRGFLEGGEDRSHEASDYAGAPCVPLKGPLPAIPLRSRQRKTYKRADLFPAHSL